MREIQNDGVQRTLEREIIMSFYQEFCDVVPVGRGVAIEIVVEKVEDSRMIDEKLS